MDRITATKKNLLLYTNYDKRETAKEIPGYLWSGKRKCWQYPLTKESLQRLVTHFPDAEIKDTVHEMIREHAFDLDGARRLKEKYFVLNEQYRHFLNYPFYDHQLKTFNFFRHLKVCADTSEPGIGKTMVQLALIKQRILSNDAFRFVIIAPLHLLDTVWKEEIEKFMFTQQFTFPIYVMNDTVPKAKEVLKRADFGIYLINYEKVWRCEEELKKLDPDMIVLDESSKIKSTGAKQTRAVLRLGSRTKYKSIMTGTVISNTYMDIFSQYKFLNPNILGSSITSFRNQYFNAYLRKFGAASFNEYEITERGKQQIKMLIDPISVSHKKADCLDLPELTVQDIRFDLSEEQAKTYHMMKDQMIAQYEEGIYTAQEILTKLQRLSMITSGFLQNTGGENLAEFKDNAKLQTFIELVDTLPEDSQVIVWAVFHRNIEMLKNHLGKKAVVYYGKLNQEEKRKSYDTFKAGKARFFIANPKSAGMGLNLSNANYAIFYSANYSFEDYAQSRERYNRTGQTKNMTEYRLIARRSIDEVIFKAVDNKKKTNDYITSALMKEKEL